MALLIEYSFLSAFIFYIFYILYVFQYLIVRKSIPD